MILFYQHGLLHNTKGKAMIVYDEYNNSNRTILD